MSFLVTSILSACLCIPLLQVALIGLNDNDGCQLGEISCDNNLGGMFGDRGLKLTGSDLQVPSYQIYFASKRETVSLVLLLDIQS